MSKCVQTKVKINYYDNTSKYLANYIEQRKSLLLSKLAKKVSGGCKPIEDKNQYPQNKFNAKVSGKKTHNKGSSSALYTSDNKQTKQIMSKQDDHQLYNQQKFIIRTTLYEKQKQLKLQFQKRKHFYPIHTDTKQHLPKRDNEFINTPQMDQIGAISTHQETYLGRHDKKKSKSKSNQQRSYKNLMRQSIEKYKGHRKNPSNVEQTQRWSRIQSLFAKMTFPFQQYSPRVKSSTTKQHHQQCNLPQQDIQKPQPNQLPPQSNQHQVELQYVNENIFNEEMHKQFAHELSGIMKEDEREELDTSNLIQTVVDQMNFNAQEPQPNVHIQSISILIPEPQIKPQENHQAQPIQLNIEFQGIQVEQQKQISILHQSMEQESEERIGMKHTESQLIEPEPQNAQVQEFSYTQPKAQHVEHLDKSKKEPSIKIIQESIVNHEPQHVQTQLQTTQNILVNEQAESQPNPIQDNQSQAIQIFMPSEPQVPPQQQIQVQQKPSLQALANIFLRPAFMVRDQTDFDLPDEQQTPLSLPNIQFHTLAYQKIDEILFNTRNMEPIPLSDPKVDQSTQQVGDDVIYNSTRSRFNKMSKLKDFGECHFLIIHEQPQEQSRQSYA